MLLENSCMLWLLTITTGPWLVFANFSLPSSVQSFWPTLNIDIFWQNSNFSQVHTCFLYILIYPAAMDRVWNSNISKQWNKWWLSIRWSLRRGFFLPRSTKKHSVSLLKLLFVSLLKWLFLPRSTNIFLLKCNVMISWSHSHRSLKNQCERRSHQFGSQ